MTIANRFLVIAVINKECPRYYRHISQSAKLTYYNIQSLIRIGYYIVGYN
jgi:hypothetical protein